METDDKIEFGRGETEQFNVWRRKVECDWEQRLRGNYTTKTSDKFKTTRFPNQDFRREI